MKPHPLARYLETTNRPLADLAKAAGTSRMSLYRIINGEQTPSLGLVQRLRTATDGAIDANDFLPEPTPKAQEGAVAG